LPLPHGLAAPPPSAAIFPVRTVVQGNAALVVADVRLGARLSEPFGPIAPRAVLLDDEGWHLIDACPSHVATVFTTPDRPWLAWADDEVVTWAPASDADP
jgi:hypothetical protein